MSDRLTWQEKAAALDALSEIRLLIRKPGDWYVHQNVSVGDGSATLVGAYGNGETPEAALNDHWRALVTDLVGCGPTEKYLVVSGEKGNRRVRWNGFMWIELPQPKAES